MGFNDGLSFSRSYYAATANPVPDFASLSEAETADVVIVGGGCTGLSTALHAAERGLSVVLLEGGRVGWGASGRNGGQIIPGLRKGAADLVAAYGEERAKRLFDLALEARALVVERIRRHAIACDLKITGHLVGAVKPRDARLLAKEVECLHAVMGYDQARYLPAEATRAEVATPYHGGLLDRSGGHMHPLNYAAGLARGAVAAGVRVYERSPAVALDRGAAVVVRTACGQVRATHAVLAGDALMHGLAPHIESHIMPVANYIAATEPLDDADTLIPGDLAISDSRFVVNYYRLTSDRRLLFGGGERYNPNAPKDVAGFVRPFMQRVFPQLKERRIDYAWGGLVSVTSTRLPHIGREGPVVFAHGYSGMGVLLSTLAGQLLVEDLTGDSSRFDLFADIAPGAFPGGAGLRGPLHVLGMLWYALRDRLW